MKIRVNCRKNNLYLSVKCCYYTLARRTAIVKGKAKFQIGKLRAPQECQ